MICDSNGPRFWVFRVVFVCCVEVILPHDPSVVFESIIYHSFYARSYAVSDFFAVYQYLAQKS